MRVIVIPKVKMTKKTVKAIEKTFCDIVRSPFYHACGGRFPKNMGEIYKSLNWAYEGEASDNLERIKVKAGFIHGVARSFYEIEFAFEGDGDD